MGSDKGSFHLESTPWGSSFCSAADYQSEFFIAQGTTGFLSTFSGYLERERLVEIDPDHAILFGERGPNSVDCRRKRFHLFWDAELLFGKVPVDQFVVVETDRDKDSVRDVPVHVGVHDHT